jgi:uncharacterized membrane protein
MSELPTKTMVRTLAQGVQDMSPNTSSMAVARHDPKDTRGPNVELSGRVAQNIETLANLQTEAEERVGRHQKMVERLTAALGHRWTLNAIVGIVALWVGVNTLAPHIGFLQIDSPPFPWLQGAVSLSALLVTTMVLTTQNRQAKVSSHRGNLDLQVNLVAEQKITKLIALLEELRRDLPSVRDRVDLVADAMAHAVDPEAVLSALEQNFEWAASGKHEEPAETAPTPAQSASRIRPCE